MDASRFALAFLLLILGNLPPSLAMQPAAGHETRSGANGKTGESPNAIAHIRFYDKDWADGHNFCTVSIMALPYNYWGGFFDCTKDEARSAKLQNIPAGSTITLYDDPDCGDSDDYATIKVLKRVANITVGGFRYDEDHDEWTMDVSYDNGLMGKVSCAEVDIPGSPTIHVKPVAAPIPAR
jgi:hypothetical protein